jgi:hypothetical protein
VWTFYLIYLRGNEIVDGFNVMTATLVVLAHFNGHYINHFLNSFLVVRQWRSRAMTRNAGKEYRVAVNFLELCLHVS